ncbi:hypothetical protein DPMN_147588 [Dreissena polymorpha]|uniref:Uncharacterized protein n=1 Tax=Dreissena polymorpha TaxID=45954 RepID=A0A9D4J348_DREPO|nr:hypothetical protein DPMN_147588 [Dreissena polymorpha]
MANRTQQVRQVARPRKRAQPPVFGGKPSETDDAPQRKRLEGTKHRNRPEEKRIRLDHQNVPGSLDLAELVMEETMDLTNVNTLLELLHNKKKQLEDVSDTCSILM